ncbi:MAG: flagellar type III secretion system pore protein FliP [Alphaproteobacteria bacterium]|nr:flagellar type III secretion system pore protein FliP [Alphaproteobacteria bacterium]
MKRISLMRKDVICACAGVILSGIFLIPSEVFAQSINLDLGQGPQTTAKLVQLIILMTVLTLAPSILIMVTSFTRITVVLSFLRNAIGVQQTPPNIVLVSLALFLTMFIMQPVFERAWDNGIKPLMNDEIDEETSFDRTVEPFQVFMLKHARQKDVDLFIKMSKIDAKPEAAKTNEKAAPASAKETSKKSTQPEAKENAVPLRALIPAFMISELRRAFEIGFLVFLPFLIIDMVIASILMSMGMMMLPPSVISLPFKVIFFVMVDGWYLVCGSLVQSYGVT